MLKLTTKQRNAAHRRADAKEGLRLDRTAAWRGAFTAARSPINKRLRGLEAEYRAHIRGHVGPLKADQIRTAAAMGVMIEMGAVDLVNGGHIDMAGFLAMAAALEEKLKSLKIIKDEKK